jgi:hypothetical protein
LVPEAWPGSPFDYVLASSKAKVLAEDTRLKGSKVEGEALDQRLNKAAGQPFHNHSPLHFEKLKGEADNIEKHLVSYIKGFSMTRSGSTTTACRRSARGPSRSATAMPRASMARPRLAADCCGRRRWRFRSSSTS